jgi:isopropylmalate/homocitrate/citramalate synthase
MKDEQIYNIFNTAKLLNRKPSVMIGKSSGLAGIAYWINENYGLTQSECLTKHDALVIALKERIDSEYEGGRQTSLSVAELEKMIEELSGGTLRRL